jgi:hypothetical protein
VGSTGIGHSVEQLPALCSCTSEFTWLVVCTHTTRLLLLLLLVALPAAA